MKNKLPTLDIIVPIFNEIECIDILFERLLALRVEVSSKLDASLLFVDDGSIDGSGEALLEIAKKYGFVKVVTLSRNFGHQIAVTAGLDYVDADYVAIIDADLQDPPELLSGMFDELVKGFDVVYGQRETREGETFFKKMTASGFYRVLSYMCEVDIPKDTGDFRIMTKRVASELKGMRERHRFIRGMVPWLGFKSYAWVLLTAIYGVFLLVELITKKSLRTILTGIFYVTLSVPLVWLITRFKGNSFFYEPLWFTNTMIESPDRVNYLEWKFLQDHYLWKKNWLRLYFLEARKLAVFYLGNLGIRSFFLGLPILAIIRKKFFSNNPVLSYVFFGFLFSSVFPLLFLQRGTVWNSIQFWYYALIFANVLVALFISELLKNKSTLTVVFVSLLLFVLAIPTSVKTIVDKNRSPYVLPAEEVQYLRSLSASDHVLICPEGSTLYKSALVKAITPAEVYVANPSQLTLVGSDQSKAKRVAEIIDQNNVADFTELLEKDRVTKIICTDASLTDKVLKMLQITGEKYGSITAITLEQ